MLFLLSITTSGNTWNGVKQSTEPTCFQLRSLGKLTAVTDDLQKVEGDLYREYRISFVLGGVVPKHKTCRIEGATFAFYDVSTRNTQTDIPQYKFLKSLRINDLGFSVPVVENHNEMKDFVTLKLSETALSRIRKMRNAMRDCLHSDQYLYLSNQDYSSKKPTTRLYLPQIIYTSEFNNRHGDNVKCESNFAELDSGDGDGRKDHDGKGKDDFKDGDGEMAPDREIRSKRDKEARMEQRQEHEVIYDNLDSIKTGA
jgi:hypothetical protein